MVSMLGGRTNNKHLKHVDLLPSALTLAHWNVLYLPNFCEQLPMSQQKGFNQLLGELQVNSTTQPIVRLSLYKYCKNIRTGYSVSFEAVI